MRRTVEVKVRVDVYGVRNRDEELGGELEAMRLVREALKNYEWFQDADEAEVVKE